MMIAYANGTANNLPNATGDYYWSSTETYHDSTNAWYVALLYGYTFYGGKTDGNYARCIHR